ncbi:DUF2778 domain-containing protein [Kangiella marina]|uniref:DUF2778 domain-containing protein n=1 Tax=Kangiella marina TaxID=1079178 RepID=A0ABP8IJ66_9GAMM
MTPSLTYNGTKVLWGKRSYKATSGMQGYQLVSDQCLKDKGPVPEGLYKVFINDLGLAEDNGTNTCSLKPAWGIQTIPRNELAGSCEPYWSNWGFHRARMEPANNETKRKCNPIRGGFYLHDSTKGYSHGCIEVDTDLLSELKNHSKRTGLNRLLLEVKYKGTTTYGKTDQ